MTSNHDSQQLPRIPSTVLAAIGILVTGFLLRRAQKKGRRSQRVAPGPPAHAGLRLLLPGGPERITMFRRLQRRYGDMVRFTIAGRVVHLVSDPEGAKHVLQDNNRNYVKGRGLEKTRDLLGEGLLTSEGEYWRRQRRLIQPIFHRRKIATFGSKMTAATEAMLARWQPRANTGEPFDVSEEMMRLTLDI
ncbi:MAG TPA: cytochrome P450, partial [Candidatus Binatia bacterium]|nr:cytochrome P450 [Candidatus Binatia bacterium]